MIGQRSVYEIIATADLVDFAGVLFIPGAIPAFVADRADLISNRNLPLDQIWSGYTDNLRSRMLESSSPEARLHILEDCLAALLLTKRTPRAWGPHPRCEVRVRAVRAGLEPVLYCRDRSAQRLERTPILTGFSRAGWIPTQGVVSTTALSTRSAAAARRCGSSVG